MEVRWELSNLPRRTFSLDLSKRKDGVIVRKTTFKVTGSAPRENNANYIERSTTCKNLEDAEALYEVFKNLYHVVILVRYMYYQTDLVEICTIKSYYQG
jgi:hypothetical protein